MKKIILTFFILLISNSAFSVENLTTVYSENNKFGLIKNNEKITQAIYLKLIPLKDESYLFLYKNKYGIISKDGQILVEPKYTSAQRYIQKFAKLGVNGRYAIFDEKGNMIIDEEYSSINILYGRMFLVKKNYKYGLISFDGDILLAPIADDIYMPKPNILKIEYDGAWYEIEQKNKGELELPKNISDINMNSDLKITKIIKQPVVGTGYGIVSASDYMMKLFSSISPACENTIDELILGYGADTIEILTKPIWLVKMPFVYMKNYVNNFKAPNNGPLSDVKTNLKNKLKN